MLTRISPALAVANWVTTHSALFGDQMPIALAGLQPQRDQAGGERIDLLGQLAIAPAHALLAHDQRRPVAPARNGRDRSGGRSFRRSAPHCWRRARSSARPRSWTCSHAVVVGVILCRFAPTWPEATTAALGCRTRRRRARHGRHRHRLRRPHAGWQLQRRTWHAVRRMRSARSRCRRRSSAPASRPATWTR